ncbi:MAG TPA: flagellar basal body P-ring formation chaperone FlgA [Terriglobia bacterium]|nr:flagellar basal body P-ring formation chaperone FlgA [Terriglobia bacterium]
MRHAFIASIVAAALGLAVWPAAGVSGPAETPEPLPAVNVPKTASVAGSRVFLSDLVSAESEGAIAVGERLASTAVTVSPPAGKAKVIDGQTVRAKLAELGVTADRYALKIPRQIRIERPAQTLLPADIEAIVRREFLPQLPWPEIDLEIAIPEPVVLPEGSLTVSFERTARADLARPFYLNLDFRVDGRVEKRAYYRAVLTVYDTMAVAARELDPSVRLTAEDVRFEKRPLTSTLKKPVRLAEFLEQKKLRTRVAPGDPLTEDMFVDSPLIRRGDAVTLVYEGSRIHVSTEGQALASGFRGERIRVINVSSRAELTAEIVDEHTVVVLK